MNLKSTAGVKVESDTNLKLKARDQVELEGLPVRVNNGTKQVARVNSAVSLGSSKVVSGAPTVLVP